MVAIKIDVTQWVYKISYLQGILASNLKVHDAKQVYTVIIKYFTCHNDLFRWVDLLCVLVLMVLASGCAYSPSTPVLSSPLLENLQRPALKDCSDYFVDIDKAIVAAAVVDAGALRITGYPYLRINRFLASFENLSYSESRFNQWVDRLQSLDQQARRFELANLPEPVRHELHQQYSFLISGEASLSEIVHFCGQQLRDTDMRNAGFKSDLLRQLDYPDEYKTLNRVLGLYTISSIFVMNGVNNLADEVKETFATPLDELEVHGDLHRYVPQTVSRDHVQLTADEVSKLIALSVNNDLGIPEPSMEVRQQLFATFAPVIDVDTADEADRLGRPVWQGGEFARIETDSPVLYTHVSYVRFGQDILLQLNYVMWFPQRPKEGTFDILGGHIDGITWRVTLGADGRPLIYDAMHNCGCYHMFFPASKLRLKAMDEDVFEEAPLVPQFAPEWNENRLVLRVESKTHYLQRVSVAKTVKGLTYSLSDYDQLRSMQYDIDSRKSLFAWDGLVRGTERAERWILWPMGIPSPGAMRQWGQHATAFVGKRHFDDADLIERYFSLESKE